MQDISFCNLSRQYLSIREELLDVTDQVYRTGVMIGGPQTSSFQSALAEYCGRKHAVVCSSGTHALEIAYRAMNSLYDIKKVVIPGFSYVATKTAVMTAGLEVLYRDVRPDGLLDVRSMLENTVLDSEVCLNYVNLNGNVLDYSLIQMVNEFFSNHRIRVVEDAAQSLGSRRDGRPSGSFGDVSVLSFDPMKILPNYNNGGMLLTDDSDMYLMMHGLTRPNGLMLQSTKSAMGEADCAQMLVKFSYLQKWMDKRRQIAEYYLSNIDNPYVELPKYEAEVKPNWGRFSIKVKDLRAARHLKQAGIEVKVHYPYPLTRDQSLFVAHQLAGRLVSLPIYPELTDAEIEHVVKSVNALDLS